MIASTTLLPTCPNLLSEITFGIALPPKSLTPFKIGAKNSPTPSD